MKPINDGYVQPQSLQIVEKYNTFINYIYPLLINMAGQHRIIRDYALEQAIAQIGLFNDAAKSSQISRLYLADAGLATIRDVLRILTKPNIKLMSNHQYGHATGILAEVGSMTNAWILKMQKKSKGNDG